MQLNIKEILIEEADAAIVKIAERIPSVTGYAASSLHADGTETSVAIWGASYIDTLQTGISPQRSVADWDMRRLQGLLYQWAGNKGIAFATKRDQWWFAVNSARKQQALGSLMWRNQEKKDIYETPAEELVGRISNRIGRAFIDYKILR